MTLLYGWRGERLNEEVARIVADTDVFPERRDYSITGRRDISCKTHLKVGFVMYKRDSYFF